MKILLLSDTHGKIDKALEIFKKLNSIDMILHCGDNQNDAYDLMRKLDIPVVSVAGNCDSPQVPALAKVETPAGRILLTHGHKENVNFDYNKLLYLAESQNCIAACFGHTHIPFLKNFEGIHLINPGSLTEPRDGSHGSFALIESTSDKFSAQIIYYDEFTQKRPRTSQHKKVQGGYLRNLLNYSDRF